MREYRTINLSTQTENKRIDTDYYVEGYATTFNDSYVLYDIDNIQIKEKIDRNALNGADMSDIIFQYDHEGKVLARKSNNTLIVEPCEKGLFICADLSKSKAAKDLYEEIRNGLITKMSWGFTVKEDDYDKKTRTRTIKKIKKVFDVSAVSIPANAGTDISARSYARGVLDIEKQELLVLRKRKLKLKIEMED
jgi:HK97 family phage prohead protease